MAMGRWHRDWLPELPWIGDRQQVQRALGGSELAARNLQVPHGGQNGFMPHKELDSACINPGLQQMGGKGVAKRMDPADFMDAGLLFGRVEDLGSGDAVEGPVRLLALEQPRRRVIFAPVIPQVPEDAGREERVAVFVPLSLSDADQHAAGIDVGDLKADQFAGAKPGSGGVFEEDAVFEFVGGGEQPADFIGAENFRQPLFRFTRREDQAHGIPPQGDAIEELQRRDIGVAGAPGELTLVEHVEDIILDLPVVKPIRCLHVMSGQCEHGVEIHSLGVVG